MKYRVFCIYILLACSIAGQSFAQISPIMPGKFAPGGEEVFIPSDDLSIHGVLYRPKKVDKTFPAVVLIHGYAPSDHKPVIEYTYVAEEYAAAGIIALAITVRGWKPTGGINDCGLTPPKDVVKVVQWLARQPGVNPEKIGLMGQSNGGQIVLSAAALDNTIKATAAYFPITDFRLWLVTNNIPGVRDYYNTHGGECALAGTPEDRSPLYTSDKITGAVLLLHGDKDNNVIIAHSQLMEQKMLEKKQNVTLHIAKGGGHGSFGPGWENHVDIAIKFFLKM